MAGAVHNATSGPACDASPAKGFGMTAKTAGTVRRLSHGKALPSPRGREPAPGSNGGRRAAPGEGFRCIERVYPLTPPLSPWEREPALPVERLTLLTPFLKGKSERPRAEDIA
jgi:hypothetical protein